MDADNVHVLDLRATEEFIWNLCSGEFNVDDMIAVLAEQYPDSAAKIDRDIRLAVTQFFDAGAVEIS